MSHDLSMDPATHKVVFSFTIYGSHRKYCQGLVENLELIRDVYPSCYTYIHVYDDVPSTYVDQYLSFPNVRLIYSTSMGCPNMIDRFMVLDDDPTVDAMIIRDTDSRIHKRDQYCIDHFLRSASHACHTIRDHNLHHSPVMGGLWGLKRGYVEIGLRVLYEQFVLSLPQHLLTEQHTYTYGYDMAFLRMCVYPLVLPSLIVYTFSANLRIEEKEDIHIIPFPVNQHLDFCGQVILYDEKSGARIREHPHPGEPYVPPPSPQMNENEPSLAPYCMDIPTLEEDPRFGQRAQRGSRKKVCFASTLHAIPDPSKEPSFVMFPTKSY